MRGIGGRGSRVEEIALRADDRGMDVEVSAFSFESGVRRIGDGSGDEGGEGIGIIVRGVDAARGVFVCLGGIDWIGGAGSDRCWERLE